MRIGLDIKQTRQNGMSQSSMQRIDVPYLLLASFGNLSLELTWSAETRANAEEEGCAFAQNVRHGHEHSTN